MRVLTYIQHFFKPNRSNYINLISVKDIEICEEPGKDNCFHLFQIEYVFLSYADANKLGKDGLGTQSINQWKKREKQSESG